MRTLSVFPGGGIPFGGAVPALCPPGGVRLVEGGLVQGPGGPGSPSRGGGGIQGDGLGVGSRLRSLKKKKTYYFDEKV